jgi:hypothetical protein
MANTNFSGPVISVGGFIGPVTGDVTGDVVGAIQVPTYTVAGAPSAATAGAGTVIYVSNGAEGSPILAFSDGTNWKRSDTGGTIAAS